MPSSADPREGLDLPGRWGRRDFVPFDAMVDLSDGSDVLSGGDTRSVPDVDRAAAQRALSPPEPTGDRAADDAAFLHYVAGAWSPTRAASLLLDLATAAGATDVHLEPRQHTLQIRLRLTGSLEDGPALPQATGRRLVAALKHLSGCLPYRSDIVQEGRVPRDGVAADVRASFLPTALGERVALRLFGRLRALDELGFGEAEVAQLRGWLSAPSGLILVGGPSGGGKTTTVYAALAHLASFRDGAHLSIEDPVEQRLRLADIPVDQVELSPERGLTAEEALVGALRQDVDVIGLAEVRTDAEAALALKAAHTGRLVLAGLHCGSAEEAHQRMLDLGVDANVLSSTLRGVVHQRLESVECEDPAPSCPSCRGTGRRRRPVVELWEAP